MSLRDMAESVAAEGRRGDRHLLHITDAELDRLLKTGLLTRNPETGLYEAAAVGAAGGIKGAELIDPRWVTPGVNTGFTDASGKQQTWLEQGLQDGTMGKDLLLKSGNVGQVVDGQVVDTGQKYDNPFGGDSTLSWIPKLGIAAFTAGVGGAALGGMEAAGVGAADTTAGMFGAGESFAPGALAELSPGVAAGVAGEALPAAGAGGLPEIAGAAGPVAEAAGPAAGAGTVPGVSEYLTGMDAGLAGLTGSAMAPEAAATGYGVEAAGSGLGSSVGYGAEGIGGGTTGGGGFDIAKLLGENKNLIVPGLAMGASLLAKPKPLTGDLQNLANTAGATANALIPSVSTGQLPAGAQTQVHNAVEDAKTSIKSKYAQMGMAGSTMEAQELAAADARGEAMKFDMANKLTVTGLAAAGVASSDYEQIMQTLLNQDSALQTALANFASSAALGAGLNKAK